MRDLLLDVRFALRTLRRSPGFAAAAVLTLALGIGGTTALFTVANGILFESLPFPDPERLVVVHTVIEGEERRDRNLSPPNFASVREESRSFEEVAAFIPSDQVLTGIGEPEKVRGARVTAGFFEVLGVRPNLGRPFRPEENEPGAGRVAIVGHRLWMERFGGDPEVIGRSMSLEGLPHTIVGVAPEGFGFPAGSVFWVPQEYDQRWSSAAVEGRRRNTWVPVLARLRPGTSLEEARAELEAMAERLRAAFPEANGDAGFSLTPLHEESVGEVRSSLLLLLGAVGLVLLVACANVAGLLLARATSRREEIAVRASLGAGRGRLVRQLAVESLVLACAGGLLGLMMASWAVELLVLAGPPDLPRLDNVRVDGTVAAFAVGVTLLAGLISGVVPAVRATDRTLARALRSGGRGRAGERGTYELQRGLIVGQVALSVVLLSGAGLLLRSLQELLHVDPGFRVEQVVSFEVELPAGSYDTDDEVRSFFARLPERLEALPGVERAGAIFRLPLARGNLRSRFRPDGQAPDEGDEPSIGVQPITPGYLATMGVEVLRGRGITPLDRADTEPVVVINRTAANRFFPGEDPVGRSLVRFSYDAVENVSDAFTIVGIVSDVRTAGLHREPEPEAYFAHAQVPLSDMFVVLRSVSEPSALAAAVRQEIRSMDSSLPVPEIQSMERVASEATAQRRFLTTLLTAFAVVTLALAAIGLFGLLSYTIAQRRREIGVRLALGATPDAMVGQVLSGAIGMVVLGLGIGILAAVAIGGVLESQLYGVSRHDPATLVGVSVVLVLVALLAGFLPARRAAAVDPIVALRQE